MKLNTSLRLGIGAAAALVIGAVAGCSHNSSTSETGSVVPMPAHSVAPIPPAQAATIVVYMLAPKSGQAKLAPDANGLVAEPLAVTAHLSDPATAAVEALTSGENSPLPSGTKLLNLKVDSGSKLATVDFSKQFQTNFKGGDTREAQSIDSVLQTLGQFPSVHSVQFLVDGHKIDSLGGTLELDEPLPTPQGGLQIASSTAG